MKGQRLLAFAILLLLSVFASDCSCGEILLEEWMDLYFLGAKIGTLHTQTIKTKYNDKNSFITRSEERTYSLRGKEEAVSEVRVVECEDENFNPIYITTEVKLSKTVTTVTCDFSGEKIKIRIESPESSHTKESENHKDILLSWGLKERMLSKGLKPGTSLSYRVFSPEKFDFVKVKTEVIGKEMLDFSNKSLKLNKLKTTIEDMNLTYFEYVDDSCVGYLIDIPIVGIKYVKRNKDLSPDKETKQPVVIEDLFFKLEGDLKKLPDLYDANDFKFLISSKSSELKDALLTTERQKIKLLDEERAEVVLYSTKDKEEKIKIDRPLTWGKWLKYSKEKGIEGQDISKEEIGRYLMASPFIQSKNEKIQKKAKEIVGKEKDLLRCSKLLCQWVFENLKNKNYQIIYAPALEVLKNLEGDCSEHTTLFITLARSLGIPARGVVGLLYSEKDKAFAFHLWAEVFVGEWFGLDPTLGLSYVTPAHLAISNTDMNDLAVSDETVAFLKLIENFKIEIP